MDYDEILKKLDADVVQNYLEWVIRRVDVVRLLPDNETTARLAKEELFEIANKAQEMLDNIYGGSEK